MKAMLDNLGMTPASVPAPIDRTAESGSNPSQVSTERPPAWLVLLMLAVAVAGFFIKYRADLKGMWLEDLPVYRHALQNWLAGRNPYNADLAPLYFLYPPIFLWMAAGIWHLLPTGWAGWAYAAVHLAATIALPLVLARFYFPQRWLSPLFALLIFMASPRFTGILALTGLNIASTLYLLAFLAAIPGIRKNRWTWFYLAVLFAASIKITFLALLLLPLLAGRRQIVGMVLCVASTVGVNLGERAYWPGLYAGYQWSLQQGILAKQAYGYGVFGVLASYHHTRNPRVGPIPYVISGLLSIALVAAMIWLRHKLEKNASHADLTFAPNSSIWLALVVLTIILVNPREMKYDMDVALLAAFVLWVYALRLKRPLDLPLLLVGWFLPSLIVPLVVLNPHLHGAYETGLALAGFAMGYFTLLKRQAPVVTFP